MTFTPATKVLTDNNELHGYRLNSVGVYTDVMKDAAPGKPVWMVLPAFTWDFFEAETSNPGKS